jgi:hypothetical protein
LYKAAWGRLQKGGTQLHIGNYELGVLLIDEKCSFLNDIPFVIPPPKYSIKEEPWIVDKHRHEGAQKCKQCNAKIPSANSYKLCSSCFVCKTCGTKLKEYPSYIH